MNELPEKLDNLISPLLSTGYFELAATRDTSDYYRAILMLPDHIDKDSQFGIIFHFNKDIDKKRYLDYETKYICFKKFRHINLDIQFIPFEVVKKEEFLEVMLANGMNKILFHLDIIEGCAR